jgi:hypothetical protein
MQVAGLRRLGGADDTGTGVACLDNWLVTQQQQAVKWDVIQVSLGTLCLQPVRFLRPPTIRGLAMQFNFGLHNLDNSSSAESEYQVQLLNITRRLLQTGAKLQYALTTPFMPDYTIGNTVVEDLNAIATKMMQAANIPLVDLYKVGKAACHQCGVGVWHTQLQGGGGATRL